jgi:Leucine-rich repeat (LRR) protein
VVIHKYGAADECRIPLPVFKRELEKLYRRAEETKSLELAWKEMTFLPPQIPLLTSLTNLHFIGNKFQDAGQIELGSLTQLTSMSMISCKIAEMGEHTGRLTALKELVLQDNILQYLPDSICKLRSLTYLNVNNNHLEYLPEHIGKLTTLIELHMSANQLTYLPDSIGGLTNLTTMVAGQNLLQTLPETMHELKACRRLIFNQNELTHLPESFAKIPNLQELRLGYNK